MNYYLVQIVLAAWDDDVDSWMNILFVLVVAIFWIVGGILKAKTSKLEGKEQEKETPRRKPSPRPVQRPRPAVPKVRVQPRPQIQRPRAKPVRPGPVEPELVFPEPEVTLKRPQIGRGVEEPRELIGKPLEKLEVKLAGISDRPLQRPAVEEKVEMEPLLDVDEPDKLRRAILHYEILGKPLSLRGPVERGIGF